MEQSVLDLDTPQELVALGSAPSAERLPVVACGSQTAAIPGCRFKSPRLHVHVSSSLTQKSEKLLSRAF